MRQEEDKGQGEDNSVPRGRCLRAPAQKGLSATQPTLGTRRRGTLPFPQPGFLLGFECRDQRHKVKASHGKFWLLQGMKRSLSVSLHLSLLYVAFAG